MKKWLSVFKYASTGDVNEDINEENKDEENKVDNNDSNNNEKNEEEVDEKVKEEGNGEEGEDMKEEKEDEKDKDKDEEENENKNENENENREKEDEKDKDEDENENKVKSKKNFIHKYLEALDEEEEEEEEEELEEIELNEEKLDYLKKKKSDAALNIEDDWKMRIYKATRSIVIQIDNQTSNTLHRCGYSSPHGTWTLVPAEQIPPMTSLNIATHSDAFFKGSEGHLSYTVSSRHMNDIRDKQQKYLKENEDILTTFETTKTQNQYQTGNGGYEVAEKDTLPKAFHTLFYFAWNVPYIGKTGFNFNCPLMYEIEKIELTPKDKYSPSICFKITESDKDIIRSVPNYRDCVSSKENILTQLGESMNSIFELFEEIDDFDDNLLDLLQDKAWEEYYTNWRVDALSRKATSRGAIIVITNHTESNWTRKLSLLESGRWVKFPSETIPSGCKSEFIVRSVGLLGKVEAKIRYIEDDNEDIEYTVHLVRYRGRTYDLIKDEGFPFDRFLNTEISESSFASHFSQINIVISDREVDSTVEVDLDDDDNQKDKKSIVSKTNSVISNLIGSNNNNNEQSLSVSDTLETYNQTNDIIKEINESKNQKPQTIENDEYFGINKDDENKSESDDEDDIKVIDGYDKNSVKKNNNKKNKKNKNLDENEEDNDDEDLYDSEEEIDLEFISLPPSVSLYWIKER
eukprot:TRINITY_DN385_c0_g1_i2.p1 TRINITY_DN385_c0_g1~~TRINITY_DN385_c0_g1_i2.p1  ORF type:complete len:690 (-),score=314.17 TRINITY_DN385_c0_g1_i2:60-2129(-)